MYGKYEANEFGPARSEPSKRSCDLRYGFPVLEQNGFLTLNFRWRSIPGQDTLHLRT